MDINALGLAIKKAKKPLGDSLKAALPLYGQVRVVKKRKPLNGNITATWQFLIC